MTSREVSEKILDFDTSLPVLLFKIGRYPIHHGIVGVIRSLGRAGIPVTAITEDLLTPASVSRHLKRRIVWTPDVYSDPAQVIERLVVIGQKIGKKPIVVCTDDEAATLVAEASDTLRETFTLPDPLPGLVRSLASKRGLNELCRSADVPTPYTLFPKSNAELEALIDEIQFPIVVKNIEPWQRIRTPEVPGTTLIQTPAELLERASSWREPFGALIQEFLPEEFFEDWVVQGYRGNRAQLAITARRLHSWPPFRGQTASARLEDNPGLADHVLSFCNRIGYQGVFDAEFRFDRRTGTYYLFDFNPRVGAPVCLFRTEVGLDPVRAMHLDLSGRPLPDARQLTGQRLIVEQLDLAARPAYRRAQQVSKKHENQGVERDTVRFAWLAVDDPLPIIAMGIRQLFWSIRALPRRLRSRTRR